MTMILYIYSGMDPCVSFPYILELDHCFGLKFDILCGLDSGIQKEIGTLQLEVHPVANS